ncbi:hypothetical protein Pst134EA_025474 [Puccinia striiformis f. sp. tritici]|uniref:hypothetical protein n=1 Tax=Puccinia striiformis f. sp. tritici TaxID=168172 RepID=UPI002007FF83|nr:hypothetical protein Pst134EA_025474 [Puccinia striiformis f. sp. tritici]KAH9451524.1 hypothetical protein Pst134EA_025474 [Puccinia striiformis f. sp. tritici]
MKMTGIQGMIEKFVAKPLTSAARREMEGSRSAGRLKSGIKIQHQAFGDFFVHEDRSFAGVRAERLSKYTSYTVSEGFQRETEKIYIAKLLQSATWKLDLRLIPAMGLFYFLSELCRLSINNIRSIGNHIGYLNLVEIPSNFIMRRIGARIFFPIILTFTGILIFCHAFLSNYTGLLVARFLVGLVNGGLFPGFLLYLSSFYTRSELQWRMALFYCTGCLAGGLSGTFAYTLTRLDGALGLAGWAWVFIIEGMLTVLGGSVGFYLFPSSLDDAGFLTADEKKAVCERLHRDRSPVAAGSLLDEKPFRSSGFQIWQAIRSPHVGLCCLAFFFAGTNVNSLTYFQPSILNSLGYGPSVSRVMSIPPYAVAFVTVLLSSYLSDKHQSRAMVAVVSGGVTAIGYSIFYISDDSSLKYGSLFLTVIGSYGIIPSLAAWMSNNSEPYARKATSLALGPIAANLGGLISDLLFPNPDQSNFSVAFMVNIVFAILTIVTCLINLGYLTYVEAVKIHRRDEVLQHYALDDYSVDASVEELLYLNGWEYLGDRHPDFRYTF